MKLQPTKSQRPKWTKLHALRDNGQMTNQPDATIFFLISSATKKIKGQENKDREFRS